MISLRLSSYAASLLFIVLRRLAGLRSVLGECDREARAARVEVWWEAVEEWRARFASLLWRAQTTLDAKGWIAFVDAL